MFDKRDKKGFIKFGIFTAIICTITVFLLCINPTVYINNIALNNSAIGVLIIILSLVSLISFVIFIELFIFILIGNHITKKNIKKIHSLTNEFRPVFLKPNGNELSMYIPNNEIKCMAKLDDNGKIIYKIQVNIENSTENYNAFLSEFEF